MFGAIYASVCPTWAELDPVALHFSNTRSCPHSAPKKPVNHDFIVRPNVGKADSHKLLHCCQIDWRLWLKCNSIRREHAEQAVRRTVQLLNAYPSVDEVGAFRAADTS